MKKIIIAVIAALFLSAPGFAFADNNAGGGFSGTKEAAGGFTGPNATTNVITVAEALTMHDDARVVLQGNIVKYLGDEKYMFQDKTGTVIIEIDDDYNWRGQTVGPEDTVVIHGKVDRDFREFEIEVKRVEKQ